MTNHDKYRVGAGNAFREFCHQYPDCLGCPIHDKSGDCRDNWEELEAEPGQAKEPTMVYLAWYHNGYTDDQYKLLGVYGSRALAQAMIDDHKVNGDRALEFKDQASWMVEEHEVQTCVKS